MARKGNDVVELGIQCTDSVQVRRTAGNSGLSPIQKLLRTDNDAERTEHDVQRPDGLNFTVFLVDSCT